MERRPRTIFSKRAHLVPVATYIQKAEKLVETTFNSENLAEKVRKSRRQNSAEKVVLIIKM
jgi:hypothetical protein